LGLRFAIKISVIKLCWRQSKKIGLLDPTLKTELEHKILKEMKKPSKKDPRKKIHTETSCTAVEKDSK
jgi:hypothetical protein